MWRYIKRFPLAFLMRGQNQLTRQLYDAGKYEEALGQAMFVESKALDLGENHPEYAWSQQNLAVIYDAIGDDELAEFYYIKAMEIRRTFKGKKHAAYLGSVQNLAVFYFINRKFELAEPLYQICIEGDRDGPEENLSDHAKNLNNLGLIHLSKSNYQAAEVLLKEAVETAHKAFGETDPSYPLFLGNLARLYLAIGSYKQAELLHRQAAEISRVVLGAWDQQYGDYLNRLALVYVAMEDDEQAEPLFHKALEIVRAVLGEKDRLTASIISNLALIRSRRGDYNQAKILFHKALDVYREVSGMNDSDPTIATILNNLANAYSKSGEHHQALPFYQEAIRVLDKIAVAHNVEKDTSLGLNLAVCYAATNQNAGIVDLILQTAKAQSSLIWKIFSMNAERQRSECLVWLESEQNIMLSLLCYACTKSVAVTKIALELVLGRKAIAAEALMAQRDAVFSGKYPHLKSKLRELSQLREQIALKILAGAGQEDSETHNWILADWNNKKDDLESELARQIPEINLEQKLRAIDCKVVAMALPPGSALIEFVRFNVFDFKAVPDRGESLWQPAQYLAFVLRSGKPDDLQMIDLGGAEGIDELIAAFRSEVTGEKEGRGIRDLGFIPNEANEDLYIEQGTLLRLVVFDKLLEAIGGCQQLFIAPDGDLTRLPFEILPTDDGGHLIDKYRMSYLGVGRDLIRFGAASSGQSTAPIVTADPDFDLTDKSSPNQYRNEKSPGRVSRDMGRGKLHFTQLPGTRIEGESIAEMLGVAPMLRGNALESRLKACQSPRILHIATHGFFLQDQQRDFIQQQRDSSVRDFGDKFRIGRFSSSNMENPLLRSGLALAGVNTWLNEGALPEEAEDGILTAEDVTGLDLLATELVVLSACETGLGEVSTGEGVLGLRRAFVLAGAKTLVMSLWKVPDKQTQELMEIFYRKILNGQPRSEALREAQLEIRENNRHPLYWGAFICQGDPNQLSEQIN
jgi:CHAT domain-containing protein/tetratricopeptide (TPR) repeat protein